MLALAFVLAWSGRPPTKSAVISEGVRVVGTVGGEGQLRIDGEVQGEVKLGSSELVIARSAVVSASVEAADVLVQGKVTGPIQAAKRVTLASGSQTTGEVTCDEVVIDPEAKLSGRLVMHIDLPRGVALSRRRGSAW